jgi:hypothetical protein
MPEGNTAMHFKTTSGSGAGALGIIGTGLALALPDAKWIGWTLVGVGLLVFVFDVHIERGHIAVGSSVSLRERFQRMWPQYLMAICGIGFFVGLVAFLQLYVTSPAKEELPSPASDDRPSSPAPTEKPEPEVLLDFASDTLPRVAPPDGIVLGFEIAEQQGTIRVGPITYQLDPNQVIDWKTMFPEWPIFGISRCEMTSTTNESVFEAVIPINLSFREMIPDSPNLPPVEVGGMIQATTGGIQMRSGKVVMTQSSSIRVGRIYPQTPYVIYFINRTQYLADIAVPSEGKVLDFNRVGNDFEKKLHVKFGRTTGMHLPSSIVLTKFPPAPLPPTPLPPSMPEKR